MNRFLSSRPVLAAAIAFGALAAGTAAHARTDVVVSIGVPARHVQPTRVYVQPQPVRYQATHRRDDQRGAWGDSDRDGVPNLYDRNSRFYNAQAALRSPWGDMDRDGVPNRYDRAPRNPYRR